MQEELNQFERNKVQNLVEKPLDHPIIGTKCVFKNKLDENRVVARNKARLVTKGYNQEEGIDFDGTFAPISRLESIRMLLAYASSMNVMLGLRDGFHPPKGSEINFFMIPNFILSVRKFFKIKIPFGLIMEIH